MLKPRLKKLISLAFSKEFLLLPLIAVSDSSSLGEPYYPGRLDYSGLSRIYYTIAVVIITYILVVGVVFNNPTIIGSSGLS